MSRNSINSLIKKLKNNNKYYNDFVQFYLTHNRSDICNKYDITTHDLPLVLKEFNLKKEKGKWYTNGKCELYISDGGIIPSGYKRGRLHSSVKAMSSKNKMWITDGKTTKYIDSSSPIPQGFYKGSLHKSTKGKHWYNDGNRSYLLYEEDATGLNKGMANTNNYKKAAQKRKKEIYNNGEIEIKLLPEDSVPDGFSKGKLTREIKIKHRDKKYLNMGYIPLRKIVEKYGKSGYVHLKDKLDIIELPDPYVYVSLKSIPMLKEYASKNHGKGSSLKEKELYEFIKSIYTNTIKNNCKSILKNNNKYYELDIYIPKLNLAIEYNGIWFHSIEYGIPKDYHLKKSLLCREKGIRLIHIYEFEDFEEQKRLLKKLIIDKVDNYPKNDFNKNNLLNNIPTPEIIYQHLGKTIYGAGKLK